MKVATILSLIMLFFGAIANSISVSAENRQVPTGGNPAHPYKHTEIPRISPYEVKALYDQGKLILVNGQESGASARNHILGAIAIPGDQFPANIVFPMNMIIAVYCN